MSISIEFDQCISALYGLHRFGIILGLETTKAILNGLGNPQNRFASVHIAGTNGKGSIASYICSILRESGFKVGLYTSPHLVRFNERIKVNNREITDQEVLDAYKAVKRIGYGDREPTFFEYTTAMAFYHFGQQNIDWAIIETGMGGRMDSTNVVDPAVSVISNISLEHQKYLGDTLEQIAFEKGGIIKKDTAVVTGAVQENVLSVFQRLADERSAPLYRLGKDFRAEPEGHNAFTYFGLHETWPNLQTGLQGRHQVDNAAIALSACEILQMGYKKQPPIAIPANAVKDGLRKTKWPGRLEKIMDSPLVILDGAHNLDAVRILSQYITEELSGRRITLVAGILDDKSYEAMLQNLLPHCARVILTRSKIDRAIDPMIMKPVAEKYISDVIIVDDVSEAVQYALETVSQDEAVCISGSLYVVGEARSFFESRGMV
ncbi:MAG: bifunctional folylpolyglutamate synthase/dihydrofolate synthase [Deltaproteobacteria bacterium]|nr:MAG: bifunctional folylpolyglutamate synthase/dihydrofolate synthase [Deltaproteobacteria bacterium]